MPPPAERISREKFSFLNSSLFSSPLNSVLTAGKTWNVCFDSSFTKPGMSRGFAISTHLPPMRIDIIAQTVSAKM